MDQLFLPSATPWVSIVIPTLNEARHLPATLRAIARGKDARAYEVIVVDGGSDDETMQLADSAGCHTMNSGRGRARQMNAAAAAARASHLWFVHADTEVPRDWPLQLRAAVAAGLPATFKLRFDYRHPLSPLRLYGWMSRFRLDAFRFGDQSLFVAARDFTAVRGFDERLDLLEDNDLVRRLRVSRNGFLLLPATVLTSARKYRRHGVIYTQGVFVVLYTAFRVGASNERLLSWYRWAFR